ncbi:ParB/RepB/Spo0J family partition protein [Polaromonas sp.]|uniref:ParB/RepB/Spo0J family partition protein n=1 Tax=Polaromonas sp. TaxID=1869339 RepID=UPI003BB5DD0C
MKEYTADAGTTILLDMESAAYTLRATPLASEAFAHIPLHQLVASLTNPRTAFNQGKLQELADSIRTSGVHQPILVRPLPGARVADTDRQVQYEIVAGERRFRACQLAGLATIPAMIRDMADGDVLEVQIIENLQRDDLTELEEAEGYDRLMQHSSLKAEEVAAKIGKSRSYVYSRLKLLDLSIDCKVSLSMGDIDASRALLIARIPDGKLQLKALKFARETSGGSDVPSVRALQIWLQQNVMLPLERAPFVITDARLVEAGSCKDCPKRTGANPDIFADVSSADICTDPACYQVKASAHELRNLARAEAKGMRLVSGSEAKAICYEKSSTLNGYSPLSQVRADADGQRLDHLLGKDFEGAVLIENPWTHQLIEAVPTAEAEGVLLARGLVKAVVEPKAKADKIELEIERLKKGIEREIDNVFREDAYDSIASAIRNMPSGTSSNRLITPQLLRAWLISVVESLPAAYMAEILQIPEKQGQTESRIEDTVRLRLQSADGPTLFQAAVLHMISDDRETSYPLDGENPTPLFAAAAAETGVDLTALRAQVTKEVKARIAGEIAALKAQMKPPKALIPTAPLAQPALAPIADANAKPTPAKLAPLRKPRLSAQEAQSGIAEAMQGIEAGQVPCPDAPIGEPAQGPEEGPQVSSKEPIQGTLAVGVIGIGARVKVLDRASLLYSKRIGKVGTVTQQIGDHVWEVTFRGRTGGLASFDASELEVVS